MQLYLDPDETDTTGGVEPQVEQTPVVETTPTETTTPETEVIPTETTETEGDINIDDFINAKSTQLKDDAESNAIVKKQDAEKAKTDKTTLEQKQEPVVKTDKQTLAEKAAKITPRDFAGILPEHKGSFERMSNDAFNTLKPLYIKAQKDAAELAVTKEQLAKLPQKQGDLPPAYYEHPQAYVLTPEFAQASTNAQLAQTVVEHWREQLDAVRAGAKEYVALRNNPQTGALEYAGKAPVDERTQSMLEGMFFSATNQASNFQQRLGAISDSFKQRHNTAIQGLKNFESQTFKVFDDPNHPLQPLIKDTINKLDPTFRSNPMAQVFGKAMVALSVIAQKYQELLKKTTNGTATPVVGGKIQQDKTVAAQQRRAGPTAGGTQTASTQAQEPTWDDFLAVKER